MGKEKIVNLFEYKIKRGNGGISRHKSFIIKRAII